jgi:copper chaperone
MQARTYEVPGIHCGHCKAAIEQEVGGLSGVSEVVVDIDAKTVTVDGIASDDEVAHAISEAGYEVATSGPATGGPEIAGPGEGEAPAPG